MKKPWKTLEFWLVSSLIASMAAVFFLFHPFKSGAAVHGYHETFHWFTKVGAAYLALSTPLYFVLKRRIKQKYQLVMRAHIFGNLAALMLISFHFALQSGTPRMLGNSLGLFVYGTLAVLLVSGFLLRYRLSGRFWPANHDLHVLFVLAFYIVVLFHVLYASHVL